MRINNLVVASAVLAGAASAHSSKTPSEPQSEVITVTDFSFGMTSDTTVGYVSYLATGSLSKTQMFCSREQPEYPEPTEQSECDDEHRAYYFAAHFEAEDSVRLRLYHILSDSSGLWGEVIVPVRCDDNDKCWGADARGISYELTTTLHYFTQDINFPPSWP